MSSSPPPSKKQKLSDHQSDDDTEDSYDDGIIDEQHPDSLEKLSQKQTGEAWWPEVCGRMNDAMKNPDRHLPSTTPKRARKEQILSPSDVEEQLEPFITRWKNADFTQADVEGLISILPSDRFAALTTKNYKTLVCIANFAKGSEFPSPLGEQIAEWAGALLKQESFGKEISIQVEGECIDHPVMLMARHMVRTAQETEDVGVVKLIEGYARGLHCLADELTKCSTWKEAEIALLEKLLARSQEEEERLSLRIDSLESHNKVVETLQQQTTDLTKALCSQRDLQTGDVVVPSSQWEQLLQHLVYVDDDKLVEDIGKSVFGDEWTGEGIVFREALRGRNSTGDAR